MKQDYLVTLFGPFFDMDSLVIFSAEKKEPDVNVRSKSHSRANLMSNYEEALPP